MPASLDDILLYQARILRNAGAARRCLDAARLQETWLRASLTALQTLDMARAEKVQVKKRVPDGDGLKLMDGRRVRYLGLDAPEVANYGSPAEPFAREARDFNRLLLSKGPVILFPGRGPNQDKHGRLLRHVFVNGRWLNAALLLTGLARPFLLKTLHPDLASQLYRCAALAQRHRLGLWASRYPTK